MNYSSKVGGSIYLLDVEANLISNIFVNNSAFIGGSLYLETTGLIIKI